MDGGRGGSEGVFRRDRVPLRGGVHALPRAAPREGDCVHEPRVAEEIDNLPAPALGGSPVDEQRVPHSAVDGLGVQAQYVQAGEVLRPLRDGAEVLGSVEAPERRPNREGASEETPSVTPVSARPEATGHGKDYRRRGPQSGTSSIARFRVRRVTCRVASRIFAISGFAPSGT